MSNTSLTGRLQGSRGWTLALGIGAALLAAGLLIAWLVQYKSSVDASKADTPVLVAGKLIPRGTSGTVIAETGLYQAATVTKDDLQIGAISDPAYLNGRVAVVDIFPGQQIKASDLTTGVSNALPTKLSGLQRGVAIPISGARGLVGYLTDGDHVDVYYETGSTGGNVLGLLASNLLLLKAPINGAPAVFRANATLAQTLALASDSGTLWFLARPAGNAKKTPKRAITSQELLALITAQPKRG
jgi:Flp pilus assembly protein CpaB